MDGRGERNHIIEMPASLGVYDCLSSLISKAPNSKYKSSQTMSDIFKTFAMGMRIYHNNFVPGVEESISTEYRDINRCDKDSLKKITKFVEKLYMRGRRVKNAVENIDGTFISVWGEKFELSSPMYSGNPQDRGKPGYTLVTAFDSANGLPITAMVGVISEKDAAVRVVERCLRLEEEEKIKIRAFVFDALYP